MTEFDLYAAKQRLEEATYSKWLWECRVGIAEKVLRDRVEYPQWFDERRWLPVQSPRDG